MPSSMVSLARERRTTVASQSSDASAPDASSEANRFTPSGLPRPATEMQRNRQRSRLVPNLRDLTSHPA